MKFPELVPDRICVTPCTVYRTEGLNRDGSKKRVAVFEGKCFHSERATQKLSAEKQLITLRGQVLFNGDISVDAPMIDGTVTNVSKSFHDDYIKENAALRSDAGLKCYINRISEGNCCPWCDEVAGRYEYGTEPQDVFRRHDNCGCTVTYESGRTRQDVWSKKSWSSYNLNKDKYAPTVLDNAQAKATEARNLSYKGIDKSGGSGIIKEKPETAVNDVHSIGRIDIEKYKCITEDITTDEVIITDERIQHINDRHPLDYAEIQPFFQKILDDPDYILEDVGRKNTGLILKQLSENDSKVQMVLRIHTSTDQKGYKNSIISAWKISESRWKNYLKNKKILYKSE